MLTYTVKDKFIQYVQIDTQADPTSTTFPSSIKQLKLTQLLSEELEQLGIPYKTNKAGYIYAHLPSNVNYKVPKIFFCAHIDTAPDCSGTDVKPILHNNYNGSSIILPDDTTQIISPNKYPALLDKIGHDIITASGNTLLGADDKAGIAIIMDLMTILSKNPDIPHGQIGALFTTDEEIGKGVANVDLALLDSDFGYTLDSGDLGCFEDENFSADSLQLVIKGISAHPGYAKGKMQNAIKILSEIINELPKDKLSPETTSGKEGFIHPSSIMGGLERAEAMFILRDFDTIKLLEYSTIIDTISADIIKKYPGSTYEIIVKNQYRNMKDVLLNHPKVSQYAINAMTNCEIQPKVSQIRGGTDGAVLSHMGIPCPNIFAGQQAIHSKHEWVSVQDMQKSVDTLLEICKLVSLDTD